MKVIQTNNRTWCIVGVPEDASMLEVIGDRIFYHYETNHWCDKLPPGTWSIFADSKTISEDDASDIVDIKTVDTGGDDYYNYFRNYEGPQEESEWPWFDEVGDGARKSFASLIRAHSLHGRQIILELLNKDK